jgi:hypothetical protein
MFGVDAGFALPAVGDEPSVGGARVTKASDVVALGEDRGAGRLQIVTEEACSDGGGLLQNLGTGLQLPGGSRGRGQPAGCAAVMGTVWRLIAQAPPGGRRG